MESTKAAGDFTFVHAADLHLDSPCKGLSETAPGVAAALRDASLEAFDQLIELTLSREAAFLLLAGDIYDGAERGLRAQLKFRDGLERLSAAGIRTFVVHGNHDPVEEGWSAVSSWPDLVHFFSSETVEAVEVEREGSVVATVQGISYPTREVTENLALGFREKAGPGLQIGLLHCNVAGTADGYAAYSPCNLEELRQVGLDYWALGHIHQTAILSGRPGGGEPWVVYPGNLQARSRKASEQGRKGAMVVSVEGGVVSHLEHVACDRIRFSATEIDVSELESVADLQASLSDLAAELQQEADERSLVLRVRLRGRGRIHSQLGRPGVLAELLDALRVEGTEETPFVWWDRLEDETASLIDLDAIAAGDDFSADLLRTAASLRQALELEELYGKMPLELKKVATEVIDEIGLAEILGRASHLALDRLEVGQ